MYERLTSRGPLVKGRGGTWIATGLREVREILSRPSFVMGARPHVIERGSDDSFRVPGPDERLLTMDSPDHQRVRNALARALAGRVSDLEEFVAATAEELLDHALEAECTDLAEEFAYPLTVAVMCHLLGLDRDNVPQLMVWSKVLGRGLDSRLSPEVQRAVIDADGELCEFMHRTIQGRPRGAQARDVIDSLVASHQSGSITYGELVGTCSLLVVAGVVTTAGLIGSAMAKMLYEPELRESLEHDPSLVEKLVEETLRLESPIRIASPRLAQEPSNIGETLIKTGEWVVPMLGLANRDSRVFEGPSSLDTNRDNLTRHIAFGTGAHRCLGSFIARMEGRLAILAVLRRIRNLEPTGPPTREPTRSLHGITSLPVRTVVVTEQATTRSTNVHQLA
jgi:cytochrome P450